MLFVDDLGYGDLGFTGHPTTQTPNIDALAHGGRVLSTWYSGCPVCSGSRAALMTGRQFARIGVPGVFSPTGNTGLPLNETTAAQQLKQANYATAIVGKWHLGQRSMYLPGARGFDRYLGIPYSDDMGEARDYLPLVKQMGDGKTTNTTILEQPLDFSALAQHYSDFATVRPLDDSRILRQARLASSDSSTIVGTFIKDNKENPFFLYMPFRCDMAVSPHSTLAAMSSSSLKLTRLDSHVHTTAANQPEKQYAGCQFKNTSRRGMFGDALAEVDWQVGEIMSTLKEQGLENNTLVLFASDNGPWMIQNASAGSEGLFTGRTSNYWNTGKGSTWEGGIRMPAFAYWPNVVPATTRTPEMVSSLDFVPTISRLAGVPLPSDRIYDGRDMLDVLLGNGTTPHETLFFYRDQSGPMAMRYGPWKAHFRTAPGLGGCNQPDCHTKTYNPPLLFNVEVCPYFLAWFA
ncbi:uncharacterized protein MONBRDRAFT_11941 [Monosiga brevicollis MX1]|uniref:Sulfatase N-terminal domain-containing protein n=1 Tax=Monosiga brevicollis TaxID=81824 RepID=A9VAR3_MONBE|nr:uncharacterized protein MONBRDRAFT_11941 [Monosiga brevicollis MX1]EDQ85419.1 predicted protein [Monosiga brevicollis MX1]|eukprot:XP_001749830.1 hypothetical protein [Monosiga brevicollis MX1]